jgi:hypothetical protein
MQLCRSSSLALTHFNIHQQTEMRKSRNLPVDVSYRVPVWSCVITMGWRWLASQEAYYEYTAYSYSTKFRHIVLYVEVYAYGLRKKDLWLGNRKAYVLKLESFSLTTLIGSGLRLLKIEFIINQLRNWKRQNFWNTRTSAILIQTIYQWVVLKRSESESLRKVGYHLTRTH